MESNMIMINSRGCVSKGGVGAMAPMNFGKVAHGPYEILYTRKQSLRTYILGLLTHTTAWDRPCGGDETCTDFFIIEKKLSTS